MGLRKVPVVYTHPSPPLRYPASPLDPCPRTVRAPVGGGGGDPHHSPPHTHLSPHIPFTPAPAPSGPCSLTGYPSQSPRPREVLLLRPPAGTRLPPLRQGSHSPWGIRGGVGKVREGRPPPAATHVLSQRIPWPHPLFSPGHVRFVELGLPGDGLGLRIGLEPKHPLGEAELRGGECTWGGCRAILRVECPLRMAAGSCIGLRINLPATKSRSGLTRRRGSVAWSRAAISPNLPCLALYPHPAPMQEQCMASILTSRLTFFFLLTSLRSSIENICTPWPLPP